MSKIMQKKVLAALLGGAASVAMPQVVQAGPTIQVGDQGSLTISYALQAWARTTDFSAADTPNKNDFYLRRNRLTFSGQANDYLGFYAQLEGGGNPGTDNKVTVRDAYLTFDLKDELRFIVGDFKNTFSRENLEACLEPLTMDRSDALAYTPVGGTRDKGVAMWGNLMDAKLQYRLMVAQGGDASTARPKDSPRLTARVHYSFLDPEFNYGYLGTYLGTQKVFTVGAAYDHQSDMVYGNYPMRSDPKDYKAWTVDAFYEMPTASGVYTASAAYFKYDTGNVADGLSPDPAYPLSGDMKGYYVKAGYMLPGKVGSGRLQFFARHDRADYAATVATTEYYDKKINAVGANYYLDGQKLKLTLELAKTTFDTPHPTITSLQDSKQATLGLQFIF